MSKHIVLPSKAERTLGWGYALLCGVFLSPVLNYICSAVGITLSPALLNLTYFGVNFLVVVLLFHRFLARTCKALLDRTLRICFIAAGLFVVYLMVSQLQGRLIAWLKPDFFNINDQSVSAIAEDYYLPALICTVFLVPITEECLHRGAIFGSLFKKNIVAAYLVSTVLFSLVHIDGLFGTADLPTLAFSFLQYIPAGLCLAAAYHLSGSVIAPILIHMAVNAIGIFALR